MHLLVLSAFRPFESVLHTVLENVSQCTFWCSVLSDMGNVRPWRCSRPVSMHLLVLSAFRQVKAATQLWS